MSNHCNNPECQVARHVLEELSVILSCASSDGETELGQVRYLQELNEELNTTVKILERRVNKLRKKLKRMKLLAPLDGGPLWPA